MRSKVTPPTDELPNFTDSGSSDLPASYGRTRLVVLPVDPFHVHAYWEVTEKDRLTVMKRLDPLGAGRLSWVLRFHDVNAGETRGNTDHFDVFVDRAARNWYIELWSSNKQYWVELGTAYGARFAPVSRSGVVELPRVAPAPPDEPQDGRARGQSEPGAPSRALGIAALSPAGASAPPPLPGVEVQRGEPLDRALPEPRPAEPRAAGPDAAQVLASRGIGVSEGTQGVASEDAHLPSRATSGLGSSGAPGSGAGSPRKAGEGA